MYGYAAGGAAWRVRQVYERRNVRMEKRRKAQSVILIAAVVIVIILVLVAGKLIDKYMPSKEQADLLEYYGLTEGAAAAVIVDYEIVPQQAVIRDERVYLDYEVVKELFNGRFYWDGNEHILLYTTPSDVVSAEISGKDYYVTEEKHSEEYVIAYEEDDTAYIAADYVKKFTDMEYEYHKEPNRVVVTTDWSDDTVVLVKKDTQIRYRGGIKSPILASVFKEDMLILLERGENWSQVATADGIIGYIPNKRLGEEETKRYAHTFEKEEFSHILKEEPINMAWHQVTLPEANEKVADVISGTKGLNVISPTWFYLDDNDGGLANLSSADYVEYCHEQGIEVWPLVSNLENDEADSTEVLTHTSKRANMINQLMEAAVQYNFDGINVDFEALQTEAGEGYVQFIRELSLKCEENGMILSVDNYVPTEYTSFYNRSEQANFADYVIIMGYDEHYAGSDEGSVASIGFVKQGITDTLKEVPANQVILGAPFFTRIWTETPKEDNQDVEAAAEDYVPYELTSQAAGMKESWNMVSENEAKAVWSEEDGQYYAEYVKEGNTYKVWLEDAESMELRLSAAKENGLAGMSFWKLGLEDTEIWDTIITYMD